MKYPIFKWCVAKQGSLSFNNPPGNKKKKEHQYIIQLYGTFDPKSGCQVNGSVQNIGIWEFKNEKYRSFIGNIFDNIGEIQDEQIDVNAQESG